MIFAPFWTGKYDLKYAFNGFAPAGMRMCASSRSRKTCLDWAGGAAQASRSRQFIAIDERGRIFLPLVRFSAALASPDRRMFAMGGKLTLTLGRWVRSRP